MTGWEGAAGWRRGAAGILIGRSAAVSFLNRHLQDVHCPGHDEPPGPSHGRIDLARLVLVPWLGV